MIGEPDDAVVCDWDPKPPAAAGFGPRGTEPRRAPTPAAPRHPRRPVPAARAPGSALI